MAQYNIEQKAEDDDDNLNKQDRSPRKQNTLNVQKKTTKK